MSVLESFDKILQAMYFPTGFKYKEQMSLRFSKSKAIFHFGLISI